MLNLVQVQEQIKGMPMEAVMQYANGSNPGVPPYVALAELNRRKQGAQMAQSQAQMPQQTVADEVKQQAQLMAAPQMQPQQPMQPGMQGQQPQVPQPGVAGLPAPGMQQGFAQGGVVNFAVGGLAARGAAALGGAMAGTGLGALGVGAMQDPPEWEDVGVGRAIMELLKKLRGKQPTFDEEFPLEAPTKNVRRPDIDERTAQATVELPEEAAPKPQPKSAASGVASLVKPQPAAPAAAPAAPDPDEQYVRDVRAKPPAVMGDDARMAQDQKRRDMFGLKEPGDSQDARIAALEKMVSDRSSQYDKTKGDRTFNNLLAMGSAYAQAPRTQRHGSAAKAYGDITKEQNAADLGETDKRIVMAEKMAQLRELSEAKRQAYREGNLARFVAAEAAEKKAIEEFQKVQSENAARMSGATKEADARRYGAQLGLEGDKIKAAATVQSANIGAASRGGGEGAQDVKWAKLRVDAEKAADAALAKQIPPAIMQLAQMDPSGKEARQIAAKRQELVQAYMARLERGGAAGTMQPDKASTPGDGWGIQQVK